MPIELPPQTAYEFLAVLDSYERCRDVAHALNLYINITDDDGVSCVEDDTHYLQVKAGPDQCKVVADALGSDKLLLTGECGKSEEWVRTATDAQLLDARQECSDQMYTRPPVNMNSIECGSASKMILYINRPEIDKIYRPTLSDDEYCDAVANTWNERLNRVKFRADAEAFHAQREQQKSSAKMGSSAQNFVGVGEAVHSTADL
eukprot:gene8676-28580_t